ncbi:7932_t:CDS:1 [Funneliformis geosporum]|uniref:936_t:CDS:1 n=1 Tax=Funneliformis geosporum TaxID=1117311 RepID=A0A9W4SKX9_9GLOM|nr:7932_t:CDS:1 [Funneliformis geosporum]CAI2170727.1 936_t:CDS:1 [Funneliformis geosporum]
MYELIVDNDSINEDIGLQDSTSSNRDDQEIEVTSEEQVVATSEESENDEFVQPTSPKLMNKKGSDDLDLKELQKEERKQRKIRNDFVQQNSSIFTFARSCPNCKKSFNSALVTKKVRHFKICCNSNNRWIDDVVLERMIEDLRFRFRPMEKRKQEAIDYDIEMSEDLKTKEIYHYFPVTSKNNKNGSSISKVKRKVNNVEDSRDLPSKDHQSSKKNPNKKKVKAKADDVARK